MKNNKKSKGDTFDSLFKIFIVIDVILFLYELKCIPTGELNFSSIIVYLIIGGITYLLLKKHESKSTTEIKTDSVQYTIKMLVLFFPVGVYLMWKNGKNKKLNAVFSVLLAIPIIFGLATAPPPEQLPKDDAPTISTKETPELQETSITTTEKNATTATTSKVTESAKTTTMTTTEPTKEETELEFTQLYLDFFEPYVNSIDKLMPKPFQQANHEKFADYDVNITVGNEDDMWSFKILDSNGDKVTLWFYPNNSTYENPPEEWNWTLILLTYNRGDKEISVSDNYHLDSKPIYNTYDKNRETPNQEVNSFDDLKTFMFGISKELSAVETTTTTTETTTETTTTTTTTTTAPPPPATEPPPPPPPAEPVIAESDYVLNTSTMKAHKTNCRDVGKIDAENRWDYYGTVEDIQSMGYSSCGHCHTW